MARGTTYGCERGFCLDEGTGAKLTRLSGFPTINHHTYMHARCFTFDSRDVVFHSMRHLTRGSPKDLFTVSTDGLLLRQLTERDGVGWMTCSPVNRSVYYAAGAQVFKVDIDSMEETQVASAPPGLSFGIISISADGRRITAFANKQGKGKIIGTDLVRQSSEVIYTHPSPVGHLQVEPISSDRVMFHDTCPSHGKPRIWCVNSDGTEPRLLYDDSLGHPSHFVWLPGRDAVISTLQHPGRGIIKIPLDDEPAVVSDAEHFWHAGASLDGNMLCSDTFNPDTGMYLIRPDDGSHRKLCLSKSTNSHPQWSHPHPTWSPDGKMVLFTSTREGTSHVYIVRITDDLMP
jgi:Tol biopolymer transport system component